MQFTGFRLFMLLTVAAMTAALPTDPESVVPEMEDIQSPQVTPSTPGHYTITQDGSYEVKNNNYANDTPAPYPDTPPAPGSMGMARGIDRNDLSRSKLPIFHWTWTKFMDSVNDMNGGLLCVNSTTRAASAQQTAPPRLNPASHNMLFRQKIIASGWCRR